MALKLLNNVELNNLLSELLSVENRDKTLGELDQALNSKLSELKKMIDIGIIDYRELQKDISKFIDIHEQSVPGSISQLLKGCLSSSGSCPINRDTNISYTYDTASNTLIPLNQEVQIQNNACAIIYLIGEPSDIDVKSLQELKDKGFNKLKIKYKDLTMSNYDTFEINDLNDHLSTEDNTTSILLITIIIGVLAYFIYRRI